MDEDGSFLALAFLCYLLEVDNEKSRIALGEGKQFGAEQRKDVIW